LSQFLSVAILPAALAAGCFSLVCMGLVQLWPIATWADFVMQVGTAVAVWGLIAFFLLLPKETRLEMKSALFRRFVKDCKL